MKNVENPPAPIEPKEDALESQLAGGRTTTDVVRIKDTVHRSIGPNAEFSRTLLKLLEEKGFVHAPRFLGADEQGREVLTFVEGDVPHGDVVWTDEQFVVVAQMLRAFHDATAGSGLAQGEEVVCHNDAAPWNTVLKENVPVAFIDFDDAAPGRRVDDFAYTAWTFLGLGSDVPVSIQADKLKTMVEAYGLVEVHDLIDAILGQQEKILAMRMDLAKNAPTQDARDFSASRIEEIRSEMAWVRENRGALEGRLT